MRGFEKMEEGGRWGGHKNQRDVPQKKWCGQKKAGGAKDMVLKNKDEGCGQEKGVVKEKVWTTKKGW